MENKMGVKLNTDYSLEDVLRIAQKQLLLLDVITPNVKSGFVKLRIKKNAHYSLVDIDLFTDGFNHDLNKEGRVAMAEELRKYLVDREIKKHVIDEKLVVSKTFITSPAPKGCEGQVLQIIFEALKNPSYLESVSLDLQVQ